METKEENVAICLQLDLVSRKGSDHLILGSVSILKQHWGAEYDSNTAPWKPTTCNVNVMQSSSASAGQGQARWGEEANQMTMN